MNTENMEWKHSGIGIVSFSINIVIVSIIVFEIVALNLFDTLVVRIPLAIFFVFPFGSLVALGLGIGGLLQNDRKKIFAILGTIFSALTIIYLLCFVIIQLSFGM